MSQAISRIRSSLAALSVAGSLVVGCSGSAPVEVGQHQQASTASPGTPGDYSNPEADFACPDERLPFAGACRSTEYFERFVSEGATLVAVQGSSNKFIPGDAIVVLEMPNAHTARFRVVSTTAANGMYHVGGKYMAGYEVLSETTVTYLATEGAFNEILTTINARENGAFRTVWYERVAKGGIGDRTYTWGSDLCTDVYGNALYAEGEMCGPVVAIASLGDGPTSDECKAWGTTAGGAMKMACALGMAYVGAQAATTGAALIVASSGTAAPAVAGLGALIGGVAGVTLICDGAKDFGAGLGELACDALSGSPAPAPESLSMELDTGLGEADACGDMGGTMYEGGITITTAGGCDDAEDSADTGSSLVLFDSEDEVSEEVIVYGDAACEPQTTASAPPGGVCIVSS